MKIPRNSLTNFPLFIFILFSSGVCLLAFFFVVFFGLESKQTKDKIILLEYIKQTNSISFDSTLFVTLFSVFFFVLNLGQRTTKTRKFHLFRHSLGPFFAFKNLFGFISKMMSIWADVIHLWID